MPAITRMKTKLSAPRSFRSQKAAAVRRKSPKATALTRSGTRDASLVPAIRKAATGRMTAETASPAARLLKRR